MAVTFCTECLGANEEDARICVHCGAPTSPLSVHDYLDRLLAALVHPAPGVAARSAFFLSAIGDPRAVPGLVEAAQRRQDMEFQEAAVEALGKLGDPAAVPVLARLLRASWLPVRLKAVDALASIGGAEARVALLRAAEEDCSPAVRERARAALGGGWDGGEVAATHGVA